MSKNKIYVVTMYRSGNRDSHSYVLGAYIKKSLALSEADKEENDRGGKYLSEILKYNYNETNSQPKEIKGLFK